MLVQLSVMETASRERARAECTALLQQFVERKIQLRAYEIYQEHGRIDGRALDDWLQAEREVLGTSILRPLFRHTHSIQ